MIPRNKPLRRSQVKRRRTGKPRRSSRELNPEYLDWIRGQPCWACHAPLYAIFGVLFDGFVAVTEPFKGRQKSPTEAAHVGLSGKPRGMSQKCSDEEAIPLCGEEHHREGPQSIHKIGPSAFFELHQADRDEVIRGFQEAWSAR